MFAEARAILKHYSGDWQLTWLRWASTLGDTVLQVGNKSLIIALTCSSFYSRTCMVLLPFSHTTTHTTINIPFKVRWVWATTWNGRWDSRNLQRNSIIIIRNCGSLTWKNCNPTKMTPTKSHNILSFSLTANAYDTGCQRTRPKCDEETFKSSIMLSFAIFVRSIVHSIRALMNERERRLPVFIWSVFR